MVFEKDIRYRKVSTVEMFDINSLIITRDNWYLRELSAIKFVHYREVTLCLFKYIFINETGEAEGKKE